MSLGFISKQVLWMHREFGVCGIAFVSFWRHLFHFSSDWRYIYHTRTGSALLAAFKGQKEQNWKQGDISLNDDIIVMWVQFDTCSVCERQHMCIFPVTEIWVKASSGVWILENIFQDWVTWHRWSGLSFRYSKKATLSRRLTSMNVVSAFLIYSAVLFSGMERASHTAPAATKDFIILKVEIVSGLNELNMNVCIKKKTCWWHFHICLIL